MLSSLTFREKLETNLMDYFERADMTLEQKDEFTQIKLIDIAEIKQGASRIEHAKKAYFVVRDGEAFQVFDSICPHRNVNIPSDAIKGMILVCPMHQWKFNLENGECIEKGNYTPLNKIKHKVENGILYLFL